MSGIPLIQRDNNRPCGSHSKFCNLKLLYPLRKLRYRIGKILWTCLVGVLAQLLSGTRDGSGHSANLTILGQILIEESGEEVELWTLFCTHPLKPQVWDICDRRVANVKPNSRILLSLHLCVLSLGSIKMLTNCKSEWLTFLAILHFRIPLASSCPFENVYFCALGGEHFSSPAWHLFGETALQFPWCKGKGRSDSPGVWAELAGDEMTRIWLSWKMSWGWCHLSL